MSTIAASAFLAFSVALPFGPVSLMCVQRSLLSGALRGLICGAGASTAHGLFAILAVVGADAVAGSLIGWQPAVHFASGAILMAIGLKMVMRTATAPSLLDTKGGGGADYLAGLMLALTNPATVLPYLALAGSGLFVGRDGFFTLPLTVAGVLLGSAAWYATLSGSAWALKERLPKRVLSNLHLVAGPALIGMGLHMAMR
ncbi:LysE family translocator [Neorhizobium galegae]|uniref:LysE family translocator n=1 Tax=Neorhizobium galegae TaxID=399 RepID=UPI0006229CA6|nr:LysE family transporter [Neorhizobium galegae]CDZ29116.1 Putative LysE/RhtB family amino acid efflux pump [Neorhizobium galegae bv. officinalis]KAA9383994.1 hypothetical protein F4V88_27400 [Neorhizobium galegae]MCM2496708.1 LysE family transporter [Neorhizobium galegae]MCQ1775635.1 LysE family transporter [Neorhizobium galegae]MCQ1798096.1 LysE family transporter [Neorhizobium galegae]